MENTMDITARIDGLSSAADTIWVLLAAILIFMMQMGFASVEAGFTRSKNTANILMKNLLDFCFGALLFWLLGFRLMFGADAFAGLLANPFAPGASIPDNIPQTAFLIFQTMFCATTATIVSGAMAERTQFRAYFVYCIFISALVYPLAGHWTWGGGWLAALGFHDFAGSAVVHSVGGWLALVGAALVGPRIGKYKNGKPRAILGHNLTIATLGVFILWIGWFGFNPGSTVGIATPALQESASQVFMNTNIAAATGALTALFAAWFRYGKPSLSLSLNGVLAGLVGITAGCDAVTPAGAAAIGILCGMAMVFAVNFFDAVVKVDDPVGAISVHGVCGSLGTVLTGVFATDGGLFYGGGWRMLGIQTLGAAVYAAWALVCGLISSSEPSAARSDCASIAASKRTDSTTTNTAKHPTTADPGSLRSVPISAQRRPAPVRCRRSGHRHAPCRRRGAPWRA